MIDHNKHLTPRQIVEELDKYIIGQNDAKKNVAIALRNRWRRMHSDEEIRGEIVPNNILMIGATGVGKNRNSPPTGQAGRCSLYQSGSLQVYRSRLCGQRRGRYGA